MGTTYKAQTVSRELQDVLTKQVAATMPVVVLTYDASGNPVITLSADSTPATGEKVVVIRVQPIAWPLANDSLGNAAIQYSHHVIQICTEANISSGSGADILTPVELLPVIVECGRRGHFVEWYQSANGTVPATGQMTAGNLKATWQDLYFNILKA